MKGVFQLLATNYVRKNHATHLCTNAIGAAPYRVLEQAAFRE